MESIDLFIDWLIVLFIEKIGVNFQLCVIKMVLSGANPINQAAIRGSSNTGLRDKEQEKKSVSSDSNAKNSRI